MLSPQSRAPTKLPSSLRNASPGISSLASIQSMTELFLQGIKELRDQGNCTDSSNSFDLPLSSTRNTAQIRSTSADGNLLGYLDEINKAVSSVISRPSQSTSYRTISTSTFPGPSPTSSTSDLTQIRHSISSSPSSSQCTMASEPRRVRFRDDDESPTPDADESLMASSEPPHHDYDHENTSEGTSPIAAPEDSTKAEHSTADYDHDECESFLVGTGGGFAIWSGLYPLFLIIHRLTALDKTIIPSSYRAAPAATPNRSSRTPWQRPTWRCAALRLSLPPILSLTGFDAGMKSPISTPLPVTARTSLGT